jgi:teichuronic acid biosynthesis glycosyltransferase TuaC
VPRHSRDGEIDVARPRILGLPGRPERLWPDRQIEAGARLSTRDGRFSLVHGQFAMPQGVAAVRLGSRWRLPVVVTLRGSDVNLWPTTRHGGLRELRAAVLGADVVTAVSSALADRAFELTGRRPLAIATGIDLEAMKAHAMPASEARSRLDWPQSAPIVTCVAHLVEGKGIRDLVAAADLLPSDVVVMLIGDGPLRRELSGAPLVRAGRLRLVGAIGHEEVPTYMAASDVVVLPSHSEGLPNVLVEAGAMGVPVVGSAVGGIPELLANEGGWLCEPRCPESLAAAITEALADPEEASRRAMNLHRTVLDEYDSRVQAGRFIGIYRQLCG